MAAATHATSAGRPEPVHGKHTGIFKLKPFFKKQGEVEKIRTSVLGIADTLEKHLNQRETAVKQAEKWAMDENPELRDLITAAADNVASTNDIQRYYNQVFHRLSTTLTLCIKEEGQLTKLGKDLEKIRKHMHELSENESERDGPASKSMVRDVKASEETHKEILKVYVHLHTRIRRALFNLSVAKIESYRKLAAVELQFIEHLRRFKRPVAMHDDGLVEFKSFASDLPPTDEFAGWMNGSWSPPGWLGDDIVASIEDIEDDMSSPGSSPGGSPAPAFTGVGKEPALENGLYPGTTAGKSMLKETLPQDPAEHPHRPRKEGVHLPSDQEQPDRAREPGYEGPEHVPATKQDVRRFQA